LHEGRKYLLSVFNETKTVARLTEIIALECGVSSAAAKQIRTAAALHDVGKQKIPKSILNKPGKLTHQEFEIVKTHTVLGAKILNDIEGELGEMARIIAMYHHERYDGGGYWGRRTGELPVYVSITAIADVFTALVCARPYKQPWPPFEALAYIENQTGMQFDPALTAVFLPLARNDSRVSALYGGR